MRLSPLFTSFMLQTEEIDSDYFSYSIYALSMDNDEKIAIC